MRLELVGSVLSWIIAVSPAAAYHASIHSHANLSDRYYYASCYCHFDLASPEKTCVPITSCFAEGGRCRGKCPPRSGFIPRPPY